MISATCFTTISWNDALPISPFIALADVHDLDDLRPVVDVEQNSPIPSAVTILGDGRVFQFDRALCTGLAHELLDSCLHALRFPLRQLQECSLSAAGEDSPIHYRPFWAKTSSAA